MPNPTTGSEIGLALPLKRAIALLVTIALCIFNLQYEPKDTAEGNWSKWSLAVFQFIVIVLLLFNSSPLLLGLTFAFSALAIIPAYFRFKDHENTRLVYMIIQGIISVGALINFATHTYKSKKRTEQEQKVRTLEFIQANEKAQKTLKTALEQEQAILNKKVEKRKANDQDKERLEKIKGELKDVDNSLLAFANQVKALEETTIPITNNSLEFTDNDDYNKIALLPQA